MARTPYRTLHQNFIVTAGDLITGDDATGAAGGSLTLEGGTATAASGAAAGGVLIRPGLPDGAGARGIINLTNNGGNDDVPVLQLTSQGTNSEDVRLLVGTRSPSAAVSANPGDLYLRHNGVVSTLYVNNGAADANTTWLDLATTASLVGTPGNIYENLLFYFDPSDRNSYPGSGSSVTDIMGNATSGTASNLEFYNGNWWFLGNQVWSVDVSPLSFIDQTSPFNNSTVGDWSIFPSSEAVGDYAALGRPSPFTSMTLSSAGGTAGIGGTVVWEYWDGAAWSALSGVSDGTSNFTVAPSAGQVVSWTLPTNWSPLSLNGSEPLYYVRARITVVYSTNPTYSSGVIASFTNQNISFTKTAALDNIFAGGGTVIAFYRPNSSGPSGEGRILDTTDALDEGWYLASVLDQFQGQQFRLQRNFDGSTGGTWTSNNITSPIDASSIRPVRLGTWSCVAVTYDDSSAANDPVLYFNGTLIASSETITPLGNAVSDAGNPLFIGNRSGNDRTFDGLIGTLLLYDRILTPTEIRTVYNAFGRRYALGFVGTDGGVGNGQSIYMYGGESGGSTGNAGDILIQAGSISGGIGSARAGDVVLRAGSNSISTGRSGAILIEAGGSTAGTNGGITIRVGTQAAPGATAGSVSISGGDNAAGNGNGNVDIRGGTATTDANVNGGNTTIRGGDGRSASGIAGVGGNVFVRGGGIGGTGTAGVTGAITISTDRNGTGGTTTQTGSITITTTGAGATGAASGDITISTGNVNGTTGNDPGDITLTGGNMNSTTQSGVSGGSITLTAGNNAGGTTAHGGSVSLISGNQTSTAASGSNAGDILLTAGTCAKNLNTARGGNITVTAGNGTGTNTSGGNISLTAGNSTGSGTAGTVTLTAGQGNTTTTGGSMTVSGGSGGSTSGAGGQTTVRGGLATAGASNGGALNLQGGTATTSGTGGLATLTGGSTGSTGVGGGVQVSGGNGGSTSGNAGAINIDAGDAVTGTGGLVSITTGSASTSGASGAFSVTTGNATGAGNASGGMTLLTGTTGDGNTGTIALQTSDATGTNRAAGDITLRGGNSTGTQEGGDISFICGNGGDTGSGGDFSVVTGNGGATSGTGGAVTLIGGDSNGASAAGTVTLTGGNAAGSGTGGVVSISAGTSSTGTQGIVNILSALAFNATVSATLAAGDNDDFTTTGLDNAIIARLTPNAGGSTITGIVGHQAYRILVIINADSVTGIFIAHEDSGSTAANRIQNPNSTATITLDPLSATMFIYDNAVSRWKIFSPF